LKEGEAILIQQCSKRRVWSQKEIAMETYICQQPRIPTGLRKEIVAIGVVIVVIPILAGTIGTAGAGKTSHLNHVLAP
jgi:hypothetical protein